LSQLIYGATQEGFSTGFFLLSLLYLLKTIKQQEGEQPHLFKWMLLSVLFANMSIYSHERYLPMLGFIALVCLLGNTIRNLKVGHRLAIIGLVLLSVAFNIVIKSYVLHLPFFKGTGGQDIVFDYNSAQMYYILALQWLFEMNLGSSIIVGLPYQDLRDFYIWFEWVLIGAVIALLAGYIAGLIRRAIQRNRELKGQFPIFLLLMLLGLLLIVPITVTIRLEHRWLQGPYGVLILLMAIAADGFVWNTQKLRVTIGFIIATLFIWIDAHYFTSGIDGMYIRTSDKFIGKFHDAYTAGRIKKGTKLILLYEDVVPQGDKDWIDWVTNYGYIFEMFDAPHKNIGYIDSTTARPVSQINDTTQIIYVYDNGIDTVDDKTRKKKI